MPQDQTQIQMGNPTMPVPGQVRKQTDWLILAVLSCLLFPYTGMCAVYYAFRANHAFDFRLEEWLRSKHNKKAKMLTLLSLVLGIPLVIVFVYYSVEFVGMITGFYLGRSGGDDYGGYQNGYGDDYGGGGSKGKGGGDDYGDYNGYGGGGGSKGKGGGDDYDDYGGYGGGGSKGKGGGDDYGDYGGYGGGGSKGKGGGDDYGGYGGGGSKGKGGGDDYEYYEY